MRLKPGAPRLLAWLLALAAAGLPAPAFAQSDAAPRLRTGPDAAPPARPDFAEPPAPAPQPAAPDPPLPVVPDVAVAAVLVEAPDAGADAVPARVWVPPQDEAAGFTLEHAPGTPLDAAWVERQFARNAIAGGDAARAVALVQLINRAFLSAGFVNSGLLVVPRDAGDGVLLLRLVHGRLVAPEPGGDTVDVAWGEGGARGLDAAFVRDRMTSARRVPVNVGAIERDFRRLADDPAIQTVNAELRPGGRPGEASLRLNVLPAERADLYVAAGNSRSPSVGGERLALGGTFRNLLVAGDLVGGEAGATRGQLDGSLAYSTPFFSPRTALGLVASVNDAAVVDAPLVPLDIESREVAAEAELVHRLVDAPLLPRAAGGWSPSRQLSVGAGLAWRRQKSFLLGMPFSFAPGSVDGRSEYGAARLLGDFVLRGVDQVLALSATGTIGLWGTRSVQPLVINPDRHFLALLVQANYARRLDRHGLELRARATAQLASSALYAGERLAIGGFDSVRGYRETLLLSDMGLIGSIELARPFSLSGAAARGDFNWGAFTIAGFADGAIGRNTEGPDPLPRSLASVGLSLEWTPADAISLTLAYGLALRDARQTGERDLQDRGVHFRFVIRPLDLLRLR